MEISQSYTNCIWKTPNFTIHTCRKFFWNSQDHIHCNTLKLTHGHNMIMLDFKTSTNFMPLVQDSFQALFCFHIFCCIWWLLKIALLWRGITLTLTQASLLKAPVVLEQYTRRLSAMMPNLAEWILEPLDLVYLSNNI